MGGEEGVWEVERVCGRWRGCVGGGEGVWEVERVRVGGGEGACGG